MTQQDTTRPDPAFSTNSTGLQASTTPGHSTVHAARSPRVGVILLWFPLFTQPFIFRDMEGLRQHLPTRIHTLYGQNLRLCSKEMCEAAGEVSRLGVRALGSVLASSLKLLVRQPRRFGRLFKDAVCRPWGSLEILGENLWAFLCGVHLARVFKEEQIDIIYSPWPRGTTTAARTIHKLTGIPYVPEVRGDNLQPSDPDLADKMAEACAIRTNNMADVQRIRTLLREAMPCAALPPVTVIYNCLTLHADRTAPLPMQAPVRLLAAGRFDITKGFDILIRSCALLRDQGVAFTLTLVGGGGKLMGLGNLENRLHQLCRELALEDHIQFPGLISHDKFPDILCNHDIFVAPCVIGPQGQRDGIPNTVIEAMSFGLPVVASAVNGLPEIVRQDETGLLVAPGSPEELACAIRDLVEHPDRARALGAAGARLAADLFAPAANSKKLADFLSSAADRAGTRTTLCAE